MLNFSIEVSSMKLSNNSSATIILSDILAIEFSFIERTFVRDKTVKKVDVDLERGKVLIAYIKDKEINFEDIKSKILVNGQNAIDFTVIDI